ncbi:MAG: 4-hydroxy-tetrahydrodipicolinate reductase [Planctomycetales bacterium]|nr:4-hydroxy-tetrahydrodipicolinate reductase [Planctomycetales bacterium]
MPIRLAVSGALGRMGRRVAALAAADPAFSLADLIEHDGHPDLGKDPGPALGLPLLGRPLRAALADPADVLVDFSAPEGTLRRIAECRARRVALVVGTTGLDASVREALAAAAREIPCLASPNMAPGVAALRRFLPGLARGLGPGTELEVVEIHHHGKADAPSGTALALAEAAAAGLGTDLGRAVHGRSGRPGPRPPGEVGLHSVRGGDVIGEHRVLLFGAGETVEIVHRVESRDVFARGALRAARWLVGRSPGLYEVSDVAGP